MNEHVLTRRTGAAATAPTTRRRSHRAVAIPAFQICLLLFVVADAFSQQKFGLPIPVSPDRILFAAFFVLLVVDPRVPWRSWRIHSASWIALAALVWASLSALYAGTLTTKLGAFALLDRLAIPYLLFVLAPVALSTRRSRVLILQVLCLLGLYLGLTAVFEVVGPHSLVFPSYIMNPHFGISFGRARGPLGGSDADASTMAICLFASVALRSVTTPRTGWRAVGALSAAASLVGVLLALTRAEWIGTGIAIVVVGLLTPSVRRRLPALILAIAIAIGAALVVSPALRDDVFHRASTSRSVYDRENTNSGGVRALESNPLFGIGWTEFLSESARYVRQSDRYPLTTTDIEIHNVPLSRLAELGLLGGTLWILSVLCGPVAAMFTRRRDDPLDEAYRVAFVGIAIVWLIAIQFSPFPYPLPNALVFLLAGTVLSPLGQPQPTDAEGR
ncbi:O-antigen ligase family protein [uncultured Jatrophihabitans sp.]|uniref:O-antigen ligase family protein n=1 Tax=uncultured Jatrophihabitans sp. TaxID=1610747 RepID=UPI0035CA8AC2